MNSNFNFVRPHFGLSDAPNDDCSSIEFFNFYFVSLRVVSQEYHTSTENIWSVWVAIERTRFWNQFWTRSLNRKIDLILSSSSYCIVEIASTAFFIITRWLAKLLSSQSCCEVRESPWSKGARSSFSIRCQLSTTLLDFFVHSSFCQS